ncbi:hypothetical protein [Pseudohongiella sp.]|uniref:Uncharacterized protein n=1 Tax=marine sediment metagenome TaxID=412755 RepID=A0A0F9YIK8_9ZZZZ|nr:hypothetical protein [Pseudohongiella sp.]HDZ07739.1 hypothetical protein [Pseudohongiella sp.]
MEIDEFEVTRIHGMNAFRSLQLAYKVWKEYDVCKKRSNDETWEERYQSADTTGTRLQLLETELFSHLSAVIVLYQASMEAILSNAVSENQSISEVVRGKSFKKAWVATLKAINESDEEFIEYERDFYTGMRIPLTHLHPNTDEKLRKVRLINFERVYNGVRFGWWAHVRILRGMGLSSGDIDSNWSYICRGVNLPPDLFPESHPNIRLASEKND